MQPATSPGRLPWGPAAQPAAWNLEACNSICETPDLSGCLSGLPNTGFLAPNPAGPRLLLELVLQVFLAEGAICAGLQAGLPRNDRIWQAGRTLNVSCSGNKGSKREALILHRAHDKKKHRQRHPYQAAA